jgi:ubiquinone/menaquinone biosynthesis C-methylase UbiE
MKNIVLDLCTGTGSLALVLVNYVDEGLVIGVDFSKGMLIKATNKVQLLGLKNIKFVMADVGSLPFKAGVFDVVTCSHSMYELTGETRKSALVEIKRILKENGRFCMMEHEKPNNTFIRFLYHIRVLSMGKEGLNIIKNELNELRKIFSHVEKEVTTTGRSKLICSQK